MSAQTQGGLGFLPNEKWDELLMQTPPPGKPDADVERGDLGCLSTNADAYTRLSRFQCDTDRDNNYTGEAA